jgi:serine/threonine protein kinase
LIQGKAVVVIARLVMLTISRPAGTVLSYQTIVNRQKTKKWADAKPANYGGDDWGDDEDWNYDSTPELSDLNRVSGFGREIFSQPKLENSYSLPSKGTEVRITGPSPSAAAEDFTIRAEPSFDFRSMVNQSVNQAFDRTDDWEDEERSSLSIATRRSSLPTVESPSIPPATRFSQLTGGPQKLPTLSRKHSQADLSLLRNEPSPASQIDTNTPTPSLPALWSSLSRSIKPDITYTKGRSDSPVSPNPSPTALIPQALPFTRQHDLYRRADEERNREREREIAKTKHDRQLTADPWARKREALKRRASSPPEHITIEDGVRSSLSAEPIMIGQASADQIAPTIMTVQHPLVPQLGMNDITTSLEQRISSDAPHWSPAIIPELPAPQIQQNKKIIMGIEFSHTEYANHKAVPFITTKQLGHGSWGIVDAVRPINGEKGVILARKLIQLRGVARKRVLPLIQKEVAILKELKHENIIQVVCTYETTSVPRQFGILLSPVGEEDLLHYMERLGENGCFVEDITKLKNWRYCLASAVEYIHCQNIRHKDIKPSNAICKGDEIFLTDFGSAHQFSTGLTSSTEGYAAGVTKMYSAPEVIDEDRRGRSADIFSLGCVFAEMTTVIHGRKIEDFHDFRSEPDPDEPERLTICYYATAHRLRDWFATGIDEEVATYLLISSMMSNDRKSRPKAEGVRQKLLVELAPTSPDFPMNSKPFDNSSLKDGILH